MTDELKDLILEVVDPHQLNTGSNWITVTFKGDISSWVKKPYWDTTKYRWESEGEFFPFEGSLKRLIGYKASEWLKLVSNHGNCFISRQELYTYWLDKSMFQKLRLALCVKLNNSPLTPEGERLSSNINRITIDQEGVIQGWYGKPKFIHLQGIWQSTKESPCILGLLEEDGHWRRYVSAWDEAIFEKDELFNPNKKEIKKMNKKEQKQDEQVIRVGVPDWVDANMIRLHGQQYTEDLIKSYNVNVKKDDASCLELKLWNPQGCILMGQINKAVNLPSSRFLNPAPFEGFTMEGGLYVIPDFNGPNDAFCIRFSSAVKKEEYVRHLLENLTEAYKQSLAIGDKVQKGNVSFNIIGKTEKDEWVLQNPISKICVIENNVCPSEDYAFYYSSKTSDGATLHKWTRAAKNGQE